jgi:hypothetical protein
MLLLRLLGLFATRDPHIPEPHRSYAVSHLEEDQEGLRMSWFQKEGAYHARVKS